MIPEGFRGSGLPVPERGRPDTAINDPTCGQYRGGFIELKLISDIEVESLA